MKTIKTPKQLMRLKPIKAIMMSSDGRFYVSGLDFSGLIQNHLYMVDYNKRTRLAKTLIDATMMFGTNDKKAIMERIKALECREVNLWNEGKPEEEKR